MNSQRFASAGRRSIRSPDDATHQSRGRRAHRSGERFIGDAVSVNTAWDSRSLIATRTVDTEMFFFATETAMLVTIGLDHFSTDVAECSSRQSCRSGCGGTEYRTVGSVESGRVPRRPERRMECSPHAWCK